MGDGLVLEQGTHVELLADPNGAYSRLVLAQKLREKKEAVVGEQDLADSAAEEADEEGKGAVQIPAEDVAEVPLGRKNTNHSLASDILRKRGKLGGAPEEDEPDMGLVELFKRLGAINKAGWKNYAFGFIAASCKFSVRPFRRDANGILQ